MGIVANQPLVRAGALDPDSLAKEHDFVDLCDTFGFPLVFLHDVPGLMIGSQAERAGILHAYERTVSRIARATVPRVGVVLRKAYGGGTSPWRRPTARTSSSPGPPPRWASWPPRPASAPCTAARSTACSPRRAGGPRRPGRRAHRRVGRRVRAVGGRGAPVARRRHRARGHRHAVATGIEIAWGERPTASVTGEECAVSAYTEITVKAEGRSP